MPIHLLIHERKRGIEQIGPFRNVTFDRGAGTNCVDEKEPLYTRLSKGSALLFLKSPGVTGV
jgi:hypothetical protein